MRITHIPKGNGKFRTIYVPSFEEKKHLKSLTGSLEQKAAKACPPEVPHGFTRHRSPVTNALAHVGHAYTLVMDLRDFFDTVDETKLRGKLSKEVLASVLVDGAARQGLPTSPAVANIAASDLDKAILKLLDKHKWQVIYTRYADDLTFSFDDSRLIDLLRQEIPQIIGRCGFKLAPEKTELYRACAGRRMITGIGVDDAIHPTRDAKRRLRAARHQGRTSTARGLAEWLKLKEPRKRSVGMVESDELMDQVRAVAKAWKLGNVHVDKIPDKGPDEDLGEDCIVTGDPVRMLGASTYTSGWTSCMRQPSGLKRRGAIYWMHLRGTRVACYLSHKTDVHGGVERRTMRARALVHTLRNEARVIDRIYGDPESAGRLEARLKLAGYISMEEARKQYPKEKVVGHAPSTWSAWFDSLKSATSTASDGRWKGRQVRVCFL